MKHLFLLAFLIISLMTGVCQDPPGKGLGEFVGIPSGISANNLIDPSWLARSPETGSTIGFYNGIKGSAFYNEDWSKGYIFFDNDKFATEIPIRFNIYTNEIYFLMSNKALVLDQSLPVKQFGIIKNGDSSTVDVFRSGYPAIDNNTEKTFYKLLVNGKISFLKHYQRKLIETTNSLGAPEKKFTNSEAWYIYKTGDNTITQIKKNKNSLLAALPEHANKIEAILSSRKLKLKDEEDFISLLKELNQVTE